MLCLIGDFFVLNNAIITLVKIKYQKKERILLKIITVIELNTIVGINFAYLFLKMTRNLIYIENNQRISDFC